ncbi:MAG: hypothetical protein ACFFCP_14945 [Promethearchaeota archaeon]
MTEEDFIDNVTAWYNRFRTPLIVLPLAYLIWTLVSGQAIGTHFAFELSVLSLFISIFSVLSMMFLKGVDKLRVAASYIQLLLVGVILVAFFWLTSFVLTTVIVFDFLINQSWSIVTNIWLFAWHLFFSVLLISTDKVAIWSIGRCGEWIDETKHYVEANLTPLLLPALIWWTAYAIPGYNRILEIEIPIEFPWILRMRDGYIAVYQLSLITILVIIIVIWILWHRRWNLVISPSYSVLALIAGSICLVWTWYSGLVGVIWFMGFGITIDSIPFIMPSNTFMFILSTVLLKIGLQSISAIGENLSSLKDRIRLLTSSLKC